MGFSKYTSDRPPCILFYHRKVQGERPAVSVFSAQISGPRESSKRAFVSHIGNAVKEGDWACGMHPGISTCGHITTARDMLMQTRLLELGIAQEEEDHDNPSMVDTLRGVQDGADGEEAETMRAESVSWRKVAPPRWARVGTDTLHSSRLPDPIPRILCLDEHARCRCGTPVDPTSRVCRLQCTVYDVHRAYVRTIEVKACSSCPAVRQQLAGPDLGGMAIFNYNNRRLFTHRLLNECTARYTTNESPFVGFCKTIRRAYLENESEVQFAEDRMFMSAWFSYTRLQELDDSFVCPECGPHPEVIICDGVTAGFNLRYMKS